MSKFIIVLIVSDLRPTVFINVSPLLLFLFLLNIKLKSDNTLKYLKILCAMLYKYDATAEVAL